MRILKTLSILSIIFLFGNTQTYSQELSAKEIIRKADEKNRGSSSKGIMSMTIIRPKWERTIAPRCAAKA